MIDIKLIIDKPDWVQSQYDRRTFKINVRMLRDAILYERKRAGKIESLQSAANKISREIGSLRKRGETIEPVISDAKSINRQIDLLNEIKNYVPFLLSSIKKARADGA